MPIILIVLFSPVLIFLYVAYLILKALFIIITLPLAYLNRDNIELGYIDESGKVQW